jgi:acetyl esterase/lipase
MRLAEKARSAGVEVTLDTVDEAPHVYQIFSSILSEGKSSIDQIAKFIRHHIA